MERKRFLLIATENLAAASAKAAAPIAGAVPVLCHGTPVTLGNAPLYFILYQKPRAPYTNWEREGSGGSC